MKPNTPAAQRVVKKFLPGQPGTRRLLEQYGDALVCVRHRHDQYRLHRYTTVELIVDKRPIRGGQDPVLGVRVGLDERRLQLTIKAAGGRWDPAAKLWKLRRSVVQALDLGPRVAVPVAPNPLP